MMEELLLDSCSKVAKLLNCDAADVAMISNASTGTNAVLRDIVYSTGDAILYLSTGYGAVERNIQYLIDTEKKRGVELHKVAVPVRLPCTHDEIMNSFGRTINEAQSQGKRIRVGVVDTICSVPGAKMPWEQMVKHLRDKQILSLVDGAHGIGQIPIDLSTVDPDFFVSNCHKWLYAHRGCAVFYTAKRNKGIQRASLPIGWDYESDPSPESNTWWAQWATPGTIDNSSFMTVSAALDFRQMLGGEERIMAYKRELAIQGGIAASRILGTSVMDVPGNQLTAAMVNVRLPIVFPPTSSGEGRDKGREWDPANDLMWIRGGHNYLFETQMNEFKLATMVFAHDGKIWVRFSAEVYLEVSDFEYAARVLLEICRRINAGEALREDSSATA
ncbi:hypothetical protein L7F22_058839 [Adiantum nelumboides]|nr:hypothetical protein [Adiantum nelumboides]